MRFWKYAHFSDRSDAGKQLAVRLIGMRPKKPIVVGLVRGGIPVASEVSRLLDAPLVPAIIESISAPAQTDLPLGAIVHADAPEIVWHEDVVHAYCASEACLEDALQKAETKLQRLRTLIGECTLHSVAGRHVILVDDGSAPAAAMRAVLQALRKHRPKDITLAVPICVDDSLGEVVRLADEFICLHRTDEIEMVDEAYRDFDTVSDAELCEAIQQASRDQVA
ncbi:MAG: phosphoribosyltransferase [Parasphingopyxis sp.]|uniref:phosphoribosyltransferase n=1 Tax=Parasphingopyxis sp. TaxID=1920299 RepID=UPI003FA0DFD9